MTPKLITLCLMLKLITLNLITPNIRVKLVSEGFTWNTKWIRCGGELSWWNTANKLFTNITLLFLKCSLKICVMKIYYSRSVQPFNLKFYKTLRQYINCRKYKFLRPRFVYSPVTCFVRNSPVTPVCQAQPAPSLPPSNGGPAYCSSCMLFGNVFTVSPV